MIFKTFIIGMVLVGITFILTELHRYQVYSEEIEREEEHDVIGDGNLLRSALYQYEDDLSELEAFMEGNANDKK